jgi:hypothetical protein
MSAEFPSVFDLGRLAGDVSRRLPAYGIGAEGSAVDVGAGALLCLDTLGSLQRIIASRRAQTLHDVAAQLVTAFAVADWLDSIEEGTSPETATNLRLLRRVVLGALPVVAEAAGIDLAEFDASYMLEFADRAFQPVTAEAASWPEADAWATGPATARPAPDRW